MKFCKDVLNFIDNLYQHTDSPEIMMTQNSGYRREVRVDLTDGLHLRPLSLIAKRAMTFVSNVSVIKGDRTLDAKSTIDLLSLEAKCGTDLIIEAIGEDAQAAVEAIVQLFETGFLIDGESTSV